MLLNKDLLILTLSFVLTFTSVFAGEGSCPWQDETLKKWADPTTWETGKLPVDGDFLIIRQGILLDMETPALRDIILVDGGKLVFSPFKETKLTADHIIIEHDGAMIIGDENCRFNAETEIVLTGDLEADESMGAYTKGISVDVGGNLDIHGTKKLSWTKLAETLSPTNSSEFTIKIVDDPVGWKQGDKLVIASTDFDMYQA